MAKTAKSAKRAAAADAEEAPPKKAKGKTETKAEAKPAVAAAASASAPAVPEEKKEKKEKEAPKDPPRDQPKVSKEKKEKEAPKELPNVVQEKKEKEVPKDQPKVLQEKKEKEVPKDQPKVLQAKPKAAAAPEEAALAEEKEEDAPKDKRKAVKESMCFRPNDYTLNVVPTMGGQVLMTLSEGGLQYLIAGARSNMGLKAGRYMFEVRVMEVHQLAEGSAVAAAVAASSGSRKPKQLLRLGFSTAGSSLVLGDSDEHVCFDAEGIFFSGRKREPKATRGVTTLESLALVLNLEPKSPNANTVSLFCDGKRVSAPMSLPESLIGKPLFPHVSFRGFTVQVHAGPEPLQELPFKCRPVGAAAAADVEVLPPDNAGPKACELLLPVGFPDEGAFDWLDNFLAKNPQYIELSDRKILDWAAASGLARLPRAGQAAKAVSASRDRPDFYFGLAGMDDFSVRRVIQAVAPLVPRNYIVMEVRANLIAEERQRILRYFSKAKFKKIACVIIGDPNEEFREMKLEKLRLEKQVKVDAAWKAMKADSERRKAAELVRKKAMQEKKKKEEERKKAIEEVMKRAETARKKAEEARKKAQAEVEKAKSKADGEEEKDAEDVDMGEDEGKEAAAAGAGEEDEDEDDQNSAEAEDKDERSEEEEETGPPRAELSEQEKRQFFKPLASQEGLPDVAPNSLTESFVRFSLPTALEGFDDLRFEWSDEESAWRYLRLKTSGFKRKMRIDTLQPGQDFRERYTDWLKFLANLQAQQRAFKDLIEAKPRNLMHEDDDLDALSVQDIYDVGGGEPLFQGFEMEDWALLNLRFELALLTNSFKKDSRDPDFVGIPEAHFSYYYLKYFRRNLVVKNFGVDNLMDFVSLVDEVAKLEDEMVLPLVDDASANDFPLMVKLTEDCRRRRTKRTEAGDETALLHFTKTAMQLTAPSLLGSSGQAKLATGLPGSTKVPTATAAWWGGGN